MIESLESLIFFCDKYFVGFFDSINIILVSKGRRVGGGCYARPVKLYFSCIFTNFITTDGAKWITTSLLMMN